MRLQRLARPKDDRGPAAILAGLIAIVAVPTFVVVGSEGAACGLILAAAGDQTRAAEYLDLGEKAYLLPQEKALLEKARRSLAQR